MDDMKERQGRCKRRYERIVKITHCSSKSYLINFFSFFIGNKHLTMAAFSLQDRHEIIGYR